MVISIRKTQLTGAREESDTTTAATRANIHFQRLVCQNTKGDYHRFLNMYICRLSTPIVWLADHRFSIWRFIECHSNHHSNLVAQFLLWSFSGFTFQMQNGWKCTEIEWMKSNLMWCVAISVTIFLLLMGSKEAPAYRRIVYVPDSDGYVLYIDFHPCYVSMKNGIVYPKYLGK